MHEQALTNLYEDKLPIYIGWAVNRTHSPELAEDLVHTAFTRAWERREQYRSGNIGGWVFRILSNELYDHIRRTKKESLTADGEMYDAAQPVEEPEGLMDILQMLKDMPEIDQEAFMLHAAGYNGQQLSERWEVPVVTANQRVLRARRRISRLQ